jgi:hypothetical protein
MLWRLPLALFLPVLFLGGGPAGAKSGDLGYPIEVGNWAGGAFADASGGFGFCSVAAAYNSGISVVFGLEPDNFFVGLIKDGWQLGKGTGYAIAMAVDGGTVRQMTASGDGDTLWIEMGRDAAFYRAVQRGHMMTVQAARESFQFELVGTSAALNKVAGCMVSFTGTSLIGDPAAKDGVGKAGKEADNPFGDAAEAGQPKSTGKAEGTQGKSDFFDPDEVLDLLDQADFPRATLLPESQVPLFEGAAPFMGWVSADEALPVVGFLLYVEGTDQPREALQDIIALMVANCPYQVASGLDALVERAGARVAGGRVLCENEDSVEVTYFAAVAKRRGVYVFAHGGDKTSQAMTRDINDKLKDALLGFTY